MKDHCGTCYYFGWRGITKWCRHPDVNRPLKKWGLKCDRWVRFDSKEPVEVERMPIEDEC